MRGWMMAVVMLAASAPVRAEEAQLKWSDTPKMTEKEATYCWREVDTLKQQQERAKGLTGESASDSQHNAQVFQRALIECIGKYRLLYPGESQPTESHAAAADAGTAEPAPVAVDAGAKPAPEPRKPSLPLWKQDTPTEYPPGRRPFFPVMSDEDLADYLASPKFRSWAVSMIICQHRATKAEAEQAIKDERDAGKISGVVNKQVLHEAGLTINSEDKAIKGITAQADKAKVKVVPCKDERVTWALSCDHLRNIEANCQYGDVIPILNIADRLRE